MKSAQDAGYRNINLDLMYALPQQTLDGALADVERARRRSQPTHISHYQLTLEPNTAFAANPPPLPDDDHAWAMQEACEARLAAAGYGQYEISAYAQAGPPLRAQPQLLALRRLPGHRRRRPRQDSATRPAARCSAAGKPACHAPTWRPPAAPRASAATTWSPRPTCRSNTCSMRCA